MNANIPSQGSASPELAQQVHDEWRQAAEASKVDLTKFDSAASYAERMMWAASLGLIIGTVLSRYSTKDQHSTSAQVLACVRYAAAHGIYVPPELVCVDEGISGRKSQRDGVKRVQAILKHKVAKVLLVFKISRLFRSSYQALRYINEEVVEEGLRAIAITQSIDTADEKMWKALMALHGIMDEMLLSTIGDHVRSGLLELFRQGYVTGALPVGYKKREVPDAPKTNRGLVRTVPQPDEEAAKLIVEHYEAIRDGAPIKAGWRRWVQAKGPTDPRSKSGYMTYVSYRRILSNPRYIGRWAFGRKRNAWVNKLDYVVQKEAPADEVVLAECEELRIMPDELFFAVQTKLASLKTGGRTTKKRKDPQLWDLVTDCFYCSECEVRFYQGGANGAAMRCKRDDICPSKTLVNRREAVQAVCDELQKLLKQDTGLIEQTILIAQQRGATGDASIREDLRKLSDKIASADRKIEDLLDLAGDDDDKVRQQIKSKIRSAREQRNALELERSRFEKTLTQAQRQITAGEVRNVLTDLRRLLEEGATGKLGQDVVYQVAEVFRLMVNERIKVIVQGRPGRKRVNVVGAFVPHLLDGANQLLGTDAGLNSGDPVEEIRVWLREPPLRDRLAETVYQLMDVQGHSYRSAAKELQKLGHNINSGVVHQIRRRYFEMQGVPVAKLPYNNGRDRGRDCA